MPTITATLTKAQGRADLSQAVSDWAPYTTTSSGNAGGTTAVFSALIGLGADYIVGKWLLMTSGTSAGDFRRITEFASSTGTITVTQAFTAQIAGSVTAEIHTYNPARFTVAINRAAQRLYPGVFRQVDSHIITTDQNAVARLGNIYGFPRNMRDVGKVTQLGWYRVRDEFNRTDASTVGNGWVTTAGTWGITGERLYSVSDANGDHLTRNDGYMQDCLIQATVRGTLASGATYRSPALTFRIAQTYANAIDTQNYLLVRLLNGVVDLRKVDAGSESSLTTGTLTTSDGVDYQVRVQARGNNIGVWVDDVQYINYNLTGLNLKYAQYSQAGIRWDKGGSPATAARVDSYYGFSITRPVDWPDWRKDVASQTIQMPVYGNLGPSGALLIEGRDMLSMLAADSGLALASDSTATMEIATTDPAYLTLIEQAKAELYKGLAGEIYPEGIPENAQQYMQLAQMAEANAKQMPRMPIATGGIRHALV